jgi:hypothetical protein
MNDAKKGFSVQIVGDHYLTVDEIWPDGDAPENPTAADVLAVMRSCGPKSRLVHDWNLDFDIEVDGHVLT